MSGFFFKSPWRGKSVSSYQRLLAGVLTKSGEHEGTLKPKRDLPASLASVNCHVGIDEERVLASLQDAVWAARETSEVITKVWGARRDIELSNIEASSQASQQFEFAARLAQELRLRGLRDRVLAFAAHRLRSGPEDGVKSHR